MAKGLSWKYLILWVSIYSIAMGFLESSVVIYLRNIYYPYGFNFPLTPITNADALVETIREFATLVMILSVSVIAAKSFRQGIAYFLYIFAIWDIAYYVFLYLLIGWPSSLLTWDILFLLPVTWVGPVIAPVIVSFSMILIALLVLISEGINENLNFRFLTWLLFITGSVVIILSFTWDNASFLLEKYSRKEIWNFPGKSLFNTSEYIPRKFNWILFTAGELLIILGIVNLSFKGKNKAVKEAPPS